MSTRKPTFICIGVQKGGTTSFINYMNQHPEIYMYEKETHFFDTQVVNKQSISKYEALFKPKNKKIIGEKTPRYCFLQYAMDNIHTYYPNIKLIIILREPIQRAYSHYNMKYSKKKYANTDANVMKDMLNNTIESSYITRGYYDVQLDYILSKFPRDNIYIGIAEEIRNNKQVEYNKIFNFLGAKNYPITNMDTHIGKYKYPIMKEDAKILYDIFKPHNEKLYTLLGRRIPIWEEYYSTILTG